MSVTRAEPRQAGASENGALWFKDAIFYEVHVRAFFDSDADGVGDFPGMTQRLDYLQDLGVTALWLLPFYPSPLKDDGYDTADYTRVHPSYGTMHDFQAFLREAHRRGMRIITELVLNHTSDQHIWFQRARRAPPGSRWRNFYVWSDTPEQYKDARVIFKDFEVSNWSWDHTAKAYYWHRFYAHQPDLNYDSPSVRRAMLRIVDFWFGLGVDGLRLDAVPYLYEREGTNCENLPETHAFLKELRRHVDSKFKDRMLLAEANQWPEDAVAYFGDGDECHMAFHFPIMPRLFMAMRMEDRFPIVEILQQTPSIPENCQWALFLRNHDELTLEMVTDEERDYMYRSYAQDSQMRVNLGIRRRLAPLLGNDRRKIELMKGLLFSLPGTPILYYGDEIGMGDNVYLGDRNGVRTPFQWSPDRNAGFSRATPQKLYLPVIIDPEYHYEAVNVESQENNPGSMLWTVKRLVALRKRYRAFGRGTIEFLQPENRKVLAFIRAYEDERILVVANLSRFAQAAELDLSRFYGATPVEMFGATRFPPIGELPYFLTLGPYSFYWFALESQRVEALAGGEEKRLRTLSVRGDWDDLFHRPERSALAAALLDYMRPRRWFGGKARAVEAAEVSDVVAFHDDADTSHLVILRVEYREGEPESYVLPLAFASGEKAERLQKETPQALVANVRVTGANGRGAGVLYDALSDAQVPRRLLQYVQRRRQARGESGAVAAWATPALRAILPRSAAIPDPSTVRAEQSNTSVVYGDKLILKLFRRLGEGTNPDLEIGRYLTGRGFAHIAPLAGAVEYQRRRKEPLTLAVLHGYIPNQGDAWTYTIDSLGVFFERALPRRAGPEDLSAARRPLLALAQENLPPLATELIGPYLESARLLGKRTAELHLALSSPTEDPAFAPEPFTQLFRQAAYHSLTAQVDGAWAALRRRLKTLPEPLRAQAERVLQLDGEIRKRARLLRDRPISALRTRTHGDYHLGQVLYTGKDFVIIDFEGEPARPLTERRIKRSPLKDVAGMLRSFHYASHAALTGQAGGVRPNDEEVLGPWALFWQTWTSATFLKEYLQTASQGAFLPRSIEEVRVLLDVMLLEKVVYELEYELNNRPDWVNIPLQGLLQLLDDSGMPA